MIEIATLTKLLLSKLHGKEKATAAIKIASYIQTVRSNSLELEIDISGVYISTSKMQTRK